MTGAAPALPPELGLPMVHLVDDEDVVRDSLAWLLRSRRLLSQGHRSAEAFEAMLETVPAGAWPESPSCLVLDLRMQGMSGLALFDRLADRGLIAALPVIFLTGHGDVPTAVATVKRGAYDFVEKPFSNNTLVDRIEQALAASADEILRRRRQQERLRGLAGLSEREQQVMSQVARGDSNKLIAQTLHLSVRTVEVHRAKVYDKLGVGSAAELANLLHAAGL